MAPYFNLIWKVTNETQYEKFSLNGQEVPKGTATDDSTEHFSK